MNKEIKESYLRILRDRHRELCDKMQDYRKLSSYLAFELEHFDYDLKVARKEFTKDELKGIWELVPRPEECPFEKLKTLETVDPSDKRKTMDKRTIPIFSESYLYETIGKDDARTVLALLNRIYESAGKVGGF